MNQDPQEQIEDFFSHYTSLRYQKGERILRENEHPSGVFYIRSGIVRMYLISEEGNELTILSDCQTIFPLRWVLADLPNIYNDQAMNTVELWRAPRDTFMELIQENPDLLMEVTGQLLNDVSALVYRMQHLVFGNAYAKVASTVLTAAKRFGSSDATVGGTMISIHLTHQQIADSAGVTRETASLEMKKLKEKELITYQGRSIVVRDMKALARASFL